MPSEYAFGESFQRKVLALYVREPQQVRSLIEPEYFTSPILMDLCRLTKQVYARHEGGEHVLSKETMYAVVRNFLGRKRQDIWPEYKSTIRKIFKDTLSDKSVVAEQALHFAKERKFRGALVSAEKDINNLKYEEAIQRFDALKGFGAERDLGIEYWKNPTDLNRWRTDRQGTIGTFFLPKLDRLMAGGPGGGELAIILAGGKAGKTTALGRFAGGALWQGKNVAIATGELSAQKYRKRMDAMITGFPTSELTRVSQAFDGRESTSSRTKVHLKEALRRMSGMHAQMKGNLYIKQWPTNKGKIRDIENWLDQLKQDKGVSIDVLFVDYIRVFRPNERFEEHRMSIGQIALDLRGLAVERNIPVWTAQQTNRAALNKERLEPRDIAEDISQFWTLDFLIAICQTEQEAKAGEKIKRKDWEPGMRNPPEKARVHLVSARDAGSGGIVPVYIYRDTFMIVPQDRKDV